MRQSAIAFLCSLLFLAGCGGGGGADTGTGTGTGTGEPPLPLPIARAPQTVYFVARDPNLQQEHIYSESDVGGALQQLTPNSPVTNANIFRVALSPDGDTIAYAANHDVANTFDLYLLPASGGTPVKVATTFPTGTIIREIAWRPDSSQLAYVANPLGRSPRGFEINEVFMVNRDGSNNRKVNGAIGSPPQVRVDTVKWSPDGRFLAQMVSILDPFLGRIGINIYDASLGRANSVRITSPVNTANFETLGSDYKWHPDSLKLAYLSEHESGNRNELFVANAAGLFQVDKLNGPLVTNGQVFQFSWSPTGDHILYQASQDDLQLTGVYISNEDGRNNRRLDSPVSGTTRSSGIGRWSPDGNRVVFAAAQAIADVPEIFVADLTGSVTRIHAPLVDGQFATQPAWSTDGGRIAYLSNMDAAGNNALFVSDASGQGGAVQVSAPTTWPAGFFTGPAFWSPDSSRLAYIMDQDIDNTFELYIGEADGRGSVRINNELVTDTNISSRNMTWSRDSTRFLFLLEDDNFQPLDLYIGLSDGSPPLQLNQTNEFDGTAIY